MKVTGIIMRFKAASVNIPARKPPVKSKRAPITYGARKPPTWAIQRKTPLAEPRYSDGIPELSINMSMRTGKKVDVVTPNRIKEINSSAPDVTTTPHRVIATPRADRASERPLRLRGMMWEKNIVAGKPAITNAEAAKPANAGVMPPVSSILGNQFIVPWTVARYNNPIIRTN